MSEETENRQQADDASPSDETEAAKEKKVGCGKPKTTVKNVAKLISLNDR